MRVSYTTYNMRRDEDTINPAGHADIIVLSHEDRDGQTEDARTHPYWYTRVLNIFHVRVRYLRPRFVTPEFQDLEVLWIRWFGRDLLTHLCI
jgi:hypothetical protein